MVRIGLVGCGFMGNTHLQAYKALGTDDVKVVAVADLRAEKRDEAKKLCGCDVYETASELLENAQIDALDICLPTYLHTEYAVAAMEKGLNVFIEKPLCLKKEEADLLISTQKKTGVQAMVGQVIRLWDEYKWLKDAADNKQFGEIESAHFRRLSSYPTWAWEGWLHKAECSGSVATDMHVHDADFIRYLMGDPKDVQCAVSRDKDGLISHVFTNYVYSDSVAVGVECCWDYPADFPFRAEYRVKFENATVDYCDGAVHIYPKEGGSYIQDMPKACDFDTDRGGNISSLGGYFNELKYFVDTLNNGGELTVATVEEAAKSLALVQKEIALAGGVKK